MVCNLCPRYEQTVSLLKKVFSHLLSWVRVKNSFRSLFLQEENLQRSQTANALRALQEGYTELVAPLPQEKTEMAGLEHTVSELVNDAYGLTQEERAVLWETAPPHMPLVPPVLS